MALKPLNRPLVHLSQCPPSSSPSSPCPYQQSHTHLYSPVLRDIPSAAHAMSTTRNYHNSTTPPTVFLLDWDDTCCATTYLEWFGIMADLDTRLDECAPQVHRALRILEQRVLTLLKSAVSLGTVLIVTNAGDGWVELSSSRFLPAVRAFLDANYKRIKIVSARARYIESYRQFPWRWKALTFSDVLQTILCDTPCKPYQLHVVVLGDSPGDRYAAYDAANTLAKMDMPVTLKIVKFLERPTIDQLCKQLAVLLDHLVVMTRHRDSFEVSMSNEQHRQQQQQQQQHEQHAQQIQTDHQQQQSQAELQQEQTAAHQTHISPAMNHPYGSSLAAVETVAAAVGTTSSSVAASAANANVESSQLTAATQMATVTACAAVV